MVRDTLILEEVGRVGIARTQALEACHVSTNFLMFFPILFGMLSIWGIMEKGVYRAGGQVPGHPHEL